MTWTLDCTSFWDGAANVTFKNRDVGILSQGVCLFNSGINVKTDWESPATCLQNELWNGEIRPTSGNFCSSTRCEVLRRNLALTGDFIATQVPCCSGLGFYQPSLTRLGFTLASCHVVLGWGDFIWGHRHLDVFDVVTSLWSIRAAVLLVIDFWAIEKLLNLNVTKRCF